MKGIEPLTSSQSDEWTTPEWIFKQLDDEFGFNLDPCCTHDSALCERHYTKEEDGLKKSWGGLPYLLIHLTHRLASGLRSHTLKA